MNDSPGLRLSALLERASEHTVESLTIPDAVELIRVIRPELLQGERRYETLSHLVDFDTLLSNLSLRELMLDAFPLHKVAEFESRIGTSIAELRCVDPIPNSQRREILRFFGQVAATEFVDHFDRTPIDVRRPLFPHQKRAASVVENVLSNDVPPRVLLHFPTGCGKTRTAMSIVASHLRVRAPTLVIWVAETRELLEQAASEFEDTWRDVGDRPLHCYRFWGRHTPPIQDVQDGIVVAGLAKLRSYATNRPLLWSLGDRTTLVVFDEAHHATAPTYKDLVDALVRRNLRTGLLGLSATPGRTWNDPEEDVRVAEMFGNNKVALDFGVGVNPITKLVEDGYLASVTFTRMEVTSPLSETDKSEVERSRELPDRIRNLIYSDMHRNLAVIRRILHLVRVHSRVLVFTGSVRNAELLSRLSGAIGCRSDVVTANTDVNQRDRIINRFRRPGGGSIVLVNVGVLTTGFDAPRATAAIIDRPTKSLVLYSQMVGRVLRGPKAGGADRCEVVTVVDTSLPGFGDVADAFSNWEDVWG